MGEQTFEHSDDPDKSSADAAADIDLLARETHVPREVVEQVYSDERAKLENTARIKTYIPVLVHSHVKTLLRERRSA